MNTSSKTRILVEGAMLIAVATLLSYIKLFELPQGGSITLEMIPLVIMGVRNGGKWGTLTAFVHGLLQLILGFSNVLYCNTLIAQIGCILLDYLLAFTVLGMVPFFYGKKTVTSVAIGTAIVGLLRFLCSFLSGWLLWGSYAPEGMSPVWYSLSYNGAYMIPNIIVAVVAIVLLYKVAPKIFNQAA